MSARRMEFDSLDEIRDRVPVGDGMRLRDIARVEIVPALEFMGWSRYNGSAVIVGTDLQDGRREHRRDEQARSRDVRQDRRTHP